MAFHVACPITCRRICFCSLGFPSDLHRCGAKDEFLNQVFKVEEFLSHDAGGFGGRRGGICDTVQVFVPKVVVVPSTPAAAAAPLLPPVSVDGTSGGDLDEAAAVASAQSKRVALQKKAAAVMVAAEDYARKFESGDLVDAPRDAGGEEQLQANVNVMCRICFSGENEGSERARKMLSCRSCSKKYHRSCLKNWAQHRDLFHWSSWTCPSCRTCEVCRRTGDPNKFMFCKRCDGAYHCYCQQPPHKNVSSGPYLCPKHTKCHSCESTVPGNGLSVRWFLGYTCCDACGRLFVKGNYCPVCLKVYRDSEATPMVCCDLCQRWVHCQCDGISEEKYLQYQVDGNLQYKCATCRGECYQVKDLEDAVQELWRRKDYADRDLIASLRAAAGLPTQEEIFSISPYSDDEENGPVILKNEYGRSLKFSLKGVVDKSSKKNKDYGKKSSNKTKAKKKGYRASSISKTKLHEDVEANHDVQSYGSRSGDDKNDDIQSLRNEKSILASPVTESLTQMEGNCSINQPGVVKHKFVDEVMVSDEDRKSRVVLVKSKKTDGMNSVEDTEKHASKSKTVKPKKLVINLGARKINVTNSPKSDASSCKVDPTTNGCEDAKEQDTSEKFIMGRHDGTLIGDKVDNSGQVKGLKFGKTRSVVPGINPKIGKGTTDENATVPPENTHLVPGKNSAEGNIAEVGAAGEVPVLRGDKSRPQMHRESNDDRSCTTVSQPKDSKPMLKFKFKKPHPENQNSRIPPPDEEEKSSIKGQRSKRKRPSPFAEKSSTNEDEDATPLQDNLMDEIMDANWILKKLGKDAIGKIVEVHQLSDISWHKGVVTDIVEGTSVLTVTLDDGRVKTLELGKQGIRFVPQKQKRSKT